MPGYMRQNTALWVRADVETCCDSYYFFARDECIANSGGDASESSSFKWYVDFEEEVCVRDCPEGTDDLCGGNNAEWEALYDTAEQCCERLWWKGEDCRIDSLGGDSAAVSEAGSSQWFVNWTAKKVSTSNTSALSLTVP